jgi:hypothetical protein
MLQCVASSSGQAHGMPSHSKHTAGAGRPLLLLLCARTPRLYISLVLPALLLGLASPLFFLQCSFMRRPLWPQGQPCGHNGRCLRDSYKEDRGGASYGIGAGLMAMAAFAVHQRSLPSKEHTAGARPCSSGGLSCSLSAEFFLSVMLLAPLQARPSQLSAFWSSSMTAPSAARVELAAGPGRPPGGT